MFDGYTPARSQGGEKEYVKYWYTLNNVASK